MVLSATERLNALPGRGGLFIDILGDRGRAHERDGFDARMLEQTIYGHLVTLQNVEHTVRQACLGEQLRDPNRGTRVFLARLEHHGVPGG